MAEEGRDPLVFPERGWVSNGTEQLLAAATGQSHRSEPPASLLKVQPLQSIPVCSQLPQGSWFPCGRGYDAGEGRSQPRTLPIDKRAAERRGLESRRRIAFG